MQRARGASWSSGRISRSTARPTARFSVRLQEKTRDEAVAEAPGGLPRGARPTRRPGPRRESAACRGTTPTRGSRRCVPAVEGKIPVIVAATSLAQIRAALAWAKEEKLRLVLFGAEDGWRIADEIARAERARRSSSPRPSPARRTSPTTRASPTRASSREAGVRVAFNRGGRHSTRRTCATFRTRPPPRSRSDFPREKAVAAITLEPARILGRRGPRRLARAGQGRDPDRDRRRHPGPADARRRRVPPGDGARPDRQAENTVGELPKAAEKIEAVSYQFSCQLLDGTEN